MRRNRYYQRYWYSNPIIAWNGTNYTVTYEGHHFKGTRTLTLSSTIIERAEKEAIKLLDLDDETFLSYKGPRPYAAEGKPINITHVALIAKIETNGVEQYTDNPSIIEKPGIPVSLLVARGASYDPDYLLLTPDVYQPLRKQHNYNQEKHNYYHPIHEYSAVIRIGKDTYEKAAAKITEIVTNPHPEN